MKTLIYSPALLIVFLLIASCSKDEAIQPRQGLSATDTLAGAPPAASDCDPNKMVGYELANATGIDSFEISFNSTNGSESYRYTFPANGRKTVAVKSGEYAVLIAPAGDYSKHTFNLNGEVAPLAPGARFANVKIGPCAPYLWASIR
jgi:hypothetical protein